MGCFAIMRGLKAEIDDAPIVDGQLFVETDQFDISDLSKYNRMYMDNSTARVELGISAWSALSKPFETIDTDTLDVDENNVLSAKNQSWNNLVNKPFETISNNSVLYVKDGELRANFEWNNITNRPFYTIGEGLNVNSSGNLNADVFSVSVSQIGTASRTTTSYQSFSINNVNNEIKGTKYMEYERTLNTSSDTTFRFESSDITVNSIIEVYSSIWGVAPRSIYVDNGVCRVIFPQHTSAVNLTCRIYIIS